MWLLSWCFQSDEIWFVLYDVDWNDSISTKQQSACWRSISRSRWSEKCLYFDIPKCLFSSYEGPCPDEL